MKSARRFEYSRECPISAEHGERVNLQVQKRGRNAHYHLMFRNALASLFVGLTAATAASPCGFHNYAPQPTLIDQLLGSDDIVLARPAPNNPFRFEAFEALEGNLASSEIPFLVDSTTRRRLALDANASVLFARDGAYGPWQRLAFVDAAMAPVLETVMTRLPAWELGERVERFSYFATLVGHPDDRIHKLALRELDQADYSILRDLQIDIDPSRLLVRINDPYEFEFKAIRILLLGLSGKGQLRDRLEKGLEGSLMTESLYLGAFATAFMELVGPEAVTIIASKHLINRDLPPLTRELLVEAIALHGQTGDAAMETAITEAIESALWVDPGLAGTVARRFGARSDWSFQPALRALIEDGTVHLAADKQDITQYLTVSHQYGEQP